MFRELQIASSGAQTLVWSGDSLVDWVRGSVYSLDGEITSSEMAVAFDFDSALSTPDGKGCVLYERLGTKAVLVHEGRLIREWNRSFYQARHFDFPICTAQLKNGRQILIHCPEEYNQLEIEDLLTGERLSTRSSNPPDFFHSRLQVSPDGKSLLSAGWFWHPLDSLRVFSLERALQEPECLDGEPIFEVLDTQLEVQSAVFTPDSHILIVTAEEEDDEDELEEEDTFFGLRPGQIGLFSPEEKGMLWTQDWTEPPGSLVLGGPWALSLYEYPRLYRWKDWTLVQEWPHLWSGKQTSSISTRGANVPVMSFDLENDRFAISSESGITLLSLEN